MTKKRDIQITNLLQAPSPPPHLPSPFTALFPLLFSLSIPLFSPFYHSLHSHTNDFPSPDFPLPPSVISFLLFSLLYHLTMTIPLLFLPRNSLLFPHSPLPLFSPYPSSSPSPSHSLHLPHSPLPLFPLTLTLLPLPLPPIFPYILSLSFSPTSSSPSPLPPFPSPLSPPPLSPHPLPLPASHSTQARAGMSSSGKAHPRVYSPGHKGRHDDRGEREGRPRGDRGGKRGKRRGEKDERYERKSR